MPYIESPASENDHLNILLFHSQAEDPVPLLKKLLKESRSSRLLVRVLDACAESLRNVQDPEEWVLYEFAELPLYFSKKPEEEAILTVLSCLVQLGCLALAFERRPALFDVQHTRTLSIGLCTGSLAAVAAACASSADQLVALSRQIICIAFRMGIAAKRRSRNIDDVYAPWCFAVKDVSLDEAQDCLDDFHKAQNLPTHRRAYISAILPNSLTISGPPNTLSLLSEHECGLSAARSKSLHIFAAFHAEHLSCPDVDDILRPSDLEDFSLRSNASIAYPGTQIDQSASVRSILQTLITQCFQAKLYVNEQTNPIPKARSEQDSCIISIGECGSKETLQNWLDMDRKLPYLEVKGDFKEELPPVEETSNQVAIVGYAGRFPHADSLAELWDIIESGKDVHEHIPSTRFDVFAHYDSKAKGKNTTASPYGCFMKQPWGFDNEFFNMSPREARQVDPIQRLLLMVTQEALEMSGYTHETCRSKRIGTYFGQATDDYRESHGSQDVDVFYVGGGMRAFAPGRLNYHFKWSGPSYSVDTACSSSLAALEFAYRAVQAGEIDLAIAGGGNLISALPMFSGLSKGKFTSPSGSCKTFDAHADGYCRGEGVGVVVIKRLNDALADADDVKGVVCGIVTNHSAQASSITHPHGPTQEGLVLRTLSAAALDPEDIDYVEFHGTGTQAGDSTELSTISAVFGGKRYRKSPLYAGAVKANVGHGEAVAGVTSLIKALLMLEHDTIPPHCGIKEAKNPAFERKELAALVIPDKAVQFEDPSLPRNILINNFNATGGNTSMILRGPPRKETETPRNLRSHYPVTLSANSSLSLHQNLKRLSEYIKRHPNVDLCNVSYSTTARRMHYRYRRAFWANSTRSLLEQLTKSVGEAVEVQKSQSLSVIFVFAGQGTQTHGIARTLFETCPVFQKHLTDFDVLCQELGFASFLGFLIDPESNTTTATQLQLGTVAVELALAFMWQAWGIMPQAVIGHSLGEYAALCVAGCISIADTFCLVGQRAKLMEALIKPGTHAMLTVNQSAIDLKKEMTSAGITDCEISCLNAEDAVAISGPVHSLAILEQTLSKQSIRVKRLDVQYAFHSAMIEPILEKYKHLAGSVPFHRPKIPVASTFLAEIVTEQDVFGPEYLVKHARRPVNFVGALSALTDARLADDKTVWIELGPGDASCNPLIHRAGIAKDRSQMISSFSKKLDSWELLSAAVGTCYSKGLDIDWMQFHKTFDRQKPRLVDLPTYAFDLKDYWIPIAEESADNNTQAQEKLTPLLHYAKKISLTGKEKSVEFYSELSDPVLYEAIRGHQVFDVALCPSSVFSTIALEAGCFFSRKSGNTDDLPEFEIHDMQITRPLIVTEFTKAHLNVSITQTDSGKTSVDFWTGTDHTVNTHARCELKPSKATNWQCEWAKLDFLVKSRIEMMLSSESESSLKLQKPVVYKLFDHVVHYDAHYHGLKSVVLNNDEREATALIDFESSEVAAQDYDLHMIDTIIHLAGFVLNNGLADAKHAYISDGWQSFRIPSQLRKTKRYKAHVRLDVSEGGQSINGDIYVLDDKHIVASCTGVRFTKMKLTSLKSLMQKRGAPSSHASTESNPTELHGDSLEANLSQSKGSQSKASKVNDASDTESRSSTPAVDAFTKIKQIIARESGVGLDEISDNSKLCTLGLDSILITQVVDQINDETGLELSSQDLQSIESISEIEGMLGFGQKSTRFQRDRQSRANGINGESKETDQKSQSEDAESKKSFETNDQGTDRTNSLAIAVETFCKVIAEQSCVPTEDVERANSFEDIGVDSLLSLEILDAVQNKTGQVFPSSFLKDNPNMAAVRSGLSNSSRGGEASSFGPLNSSKELATANTWSKVKCDKTVNGTTVSTSSSQATKNAPSSRDAKEGEKDQRTNREKPELNARVTLLQGNPQDETAPLFLFPPGLGTVAIYTRFPKHPENIPIYGVTSPFVHQGLREDYTFENAAELYIEAVQRTRPNGPYHLGGWSLGGCMAYEVCRRLLSRGVTIGALIIIDCPRPQNIPRTPKLTLDAFTVFRYDDFVIERHGTFPQNLKEHIVGVMNAFKQYQAIPMKSKQPSYAICIQATQGNQQMLMQCAIKSQQLLDKNGGNIETSAKELSLEFDFDADVTYPYKAKHELGPAGWEEFIKELDFDIIDIDHVGLFTNDEALKELTNSLFTAIHRGQKALFEVND